MKKLIILLLILYSCGSKKTITEYKEVIKRDSIYITKDRKIVERVIDTFKIDKPCDSLGNLKPFKRTLITKQGKITLQGINNEINANIDLKGYESVIEKKYKLIYDKKLSEILKEEIRYKIPLWSWLTHFFLFLIIVLLLRSKLQ